MTQRKEVIAFVAAFPGKTATEIGRGVAFRISSVASLLNQAVKEGLLFRQEGKGPRGGYTYFATPVRPGPRTRFDRVLSKKR